MFISEIYESRQGEGLLTGTPSVFVRTSGCNLRCHFCDTPFTSWAPEGNSRTVDDVVEQIQRFEAEHVVVTGGEPLLAKDLGDLTSGLKRLGKHVTLETAGTVFQSIDCDLMSISPKLANSTPSVERAGDWAERHEKTRINIEATTKLMGLCEYQLKFVVADPTDVAEIEQFLSRLPAYEVGRVLLMPEGVDVTTLEQRGEWLEEICLEKGFRFCQRKHIFWYGNRRGT